MPPAEFGRIPRTAFRIAARSVRLLSDMCRRFSIALWADRGINVSRGKQICATRVFLLPSHALAHHARNLQLQPPKQFAESLSGLIERVTFFNEENGFAVLKVKAKGHRDQVTVIGSLPSVSAGEWVTAQGRWIQDREFGLQFRAEMLTSTAPTSKEGIEKYLGSGMVKGIGPIYAKKLVDKFGEQLFHHRERIRPARRTGRDRPETPETD